MYGFGQITGIDVSPLGDGTLTLSVTLTDIAGNSGTAATDTVEKDATAPTGYSVAIDQPDINNGNKDAMSFTFSGAEVGTAYKNNGIVPQYYVENSHEPIIPKDLYMQVQEEMVRRGNLNSGNKKRVYSSKYALSGIVCCGNCGDIYRRIAWNNRGKRSIVWRCVRRVEHGPSECDAPTILETDLQAAVVKAINLVLGDRDRILKGLRDNIETVLRQENGTTIGGIDVQLEELQKELLKRANEKVEYDDIADEISRLRELKQKALSESAQREGLKQRITEMTEFLSQHTGTVDEYDEQLVRRLVEKVAVYEDRFVVEFKSGMNVEIDKRKFSPGGECFKGLCGYGLYSYIVV